MSISFPSEPPEYRLARDRLLQQEVELRRATEAVAAARRGRSAGLCLLQAGPDGTPTDVRLSQLFAPGKDTLVIYNSMFPRALDDEQPYPHCTSILDALGRDRAAHHPARQFRGLSLGGTFAHPCPCASARLAGAAVVVLGRHYLQPRLLRRGRGGCSNADLSIGKGEERSEKE
jgi:hypothetical protein